LAAISEYITKGNLFRCWTIHQESQLCVGCCGLVETTHHLFLGYSFFCSIWLLVRHWLEAHSADSLSITDHFLQFQLIRLSKIKAFIYVIDLVCEFLGDLKGKKCRDFP